MFDVPVNLGKTASKRHEQLADLEGKASLIRGGFFLPGEAQTGTLILEDKRRRREYFFGEEYGSVEGANILEHIM